MIARNRIRCIVVRVGTDADRRSPRGALARDLLPWADPYVAGLIKKLQDEVRDERRQRAGVRSDRFSRSRRGAMPLHDRFATRSAVDVDPSWFDRSIDLGSARFDDDLDDATFRC